MVFMLKPLFAIVALVTSVSAHTIFQEIYVNGVSAGHSNGIRIVTYNGPILDVTSNDIICNGGPNPFKTPFSQTVIPVKAGDTLTGEWHHGGNGPDPNDGDDPIADSHKGPVIVYLAKVPSATQTTTTGLQWFKIYEDGLTNGVWAVDKLIAADGKHSFKIPTCIADGDYLLRAEIIALHPAGSYPGAQFYIGCGQLRITGGTSVVTPATVSFPGAYAGSDPGITVNIYYPPLTNYVIPGPPVFTCGGTQPPVSSSTRISSTSSTRTSTSSTRTSSSSTSTRTATSSTRPPSSSSSSTRPPSSSSSSTPSTGGAPLWGQCGGIGWTGPTTCAQGTCKKSNDYYSQCLE